MRLIVNASNDEQIVEEQVVQPGEIVEVHPALGSRLVRLEGEIWRRTTAEERADWQEARE